MMRPWRLLPASWAHNLAPLAVKLAAEIAGDKESSDWHPLDWRGLHFPNRLGVAGGLDKNGETMLAWQSLGAGFIEIGTVTPQPQLANPGKILDRDWQSQNLWNRMGFPNDGATEIAFNFRQVKDDLKIPVFVNLGKNRDTPNEHAVDDYLASIPKFPFASGFVINVSSPNTAGLRDLQSRSTLAPLCRAISHAAVPRPVLVKLSPDMSEVELKESIAAALEGGVAGFVLTNTTSDRPANCPFPKEGGLSGRDLRARSIQALKWALAMQRGGSFLLVSVGGVLSYDDWKERLDLGADLVEVYTATVFHGPFFFRNIKQQWQNSFSKE